MNKSFLLAAVVLSAAIVSAIPLRAKEKAEAMPEYEPEIIKLPDPKCDSSTSIEGALLKRRSVRDFKDKPVTLSEVSQLLWDAYGIAGDGFSIPSNGHSQSSHS